VPLFGTLIGLLVDGEPVVGVIHLPALGETVWATRGGGCWFGLAGSVEKPQRVQVASPVPLERAFVSTTGTHGSDLRERPGEPCFQLGAVIRAAGRFRFVGDCMQHALVCRGRLHAAIDTIMSPWDTAALIPCLREAGAVATALTGEPDNVVFSGSLLASCDVNLHREIVALIN
jgi:histidinol-phosphatase